MSSVARRVGRRKKSSVLGEPRVMSRSELEAMDFDARAEVIKQLIPLGLMAVNDMLKAEVTQLAGERHAREGREPGLVRYGHNPGSVRLAGQRVPIRVPRVRDYVKGREVSLSSLEAVRRATGEIDETLLYRVLHGLSCRDYQGAAEAVPGAIGLSSSSVSREFTRATAGKLQELQERDLSDLDIVAVVIDGKSFADEMMVTALGVMTGGRKVLLGFVEADTENTAVLTRFLRELLDRGLKVDDGLLVVMDGSKGLRAAVRRAFRGRALVQRCHWHKRENVLEYLPKSEHSYWRKRLQRAYQQSTYEEARAALMKVRAELEERNLSAVKSLDEGLEETLTLHRLGVFPLLGISLKTTNCLESIFSLVDARCDRVCYWKNSSQKQRWLAASLLDIEPRLRRIQGYKHLSILREAIQRDLGLRKEVSVA